MRGGQDEVAAAVAGRWRRLDDRAVFRLTGPDRVRYLNGQVSNDVSKLDGGALAACLCGIKGKVEALVWIHADGEALVLDGELRQRDFLRARLERYLIADDCEIEDATERVSLLHHFIAEGGGIPSRRLAAAGSDRFAWDGAASAPLPEDGEIGAEEWNLLETLSGTPRSGWEINGEEFPAELGLDAWAVDFHKGCYLGQEIVSRIRSVGRVKRELVRVLCGSPLAQGTAVRTEDGDLGVATRPSIPFRGKNHLALALLGKGRKDSNFHEIQVVARHSGDLD